jgi:hypothetical protein
MGRFRTCCLTIGGLPVSELEHGLQRAIALAAAPCGVRLLQRGDRQRASAARLGGADVFVWVESPG